jgi:hypothetical protein
MNTYFNKIAPLSISGNFTHILHIRLNYMTRYNFGYTLTPEAPEAPEKNFSFEYIEDICQFLKNDCKVPNIFMRWEAIDGGYELFGANTNYNDDMIHHVVSETIYSIVKHIKHNYMNDFL